MASHRWGIEGVGKGLGGSFLSDAQAKHSGNPPDDTLLRDTAKELEQLFDEFQVNPAARRWRGRVATLSHDVVLHSRCATRSLRRTAKRATRSHQVFASSVCS